MLKRPWLALSLAVLLAACFALGLLQLFALRFAEGDVYPPYSSLRADPLGTLAIYESLAELPGVAVERNYRPLPRLKADAPVTLVYAGIRREVFWEERELRRFETLVESGSRAVFAFFPTDRTVDQAEFQRQAREKDERAKEERVKRRSERAKKDGDKNADPEADEKKSGRDPSLRSFKEVAERWGFSFDMLPPAPTDAYHRTAVVMEPGAGIETEPSWHSGICFKDLKPEWKVLYTCELKPVVIERKYGTGSIILASDSYFLSNEALRHERHPRLLSRVFSGPDRVVFDEEHLGVTEVPGIATLVRKYRLHGTVLVLLLLAALFIWKNASPLVPTRGDGAEAESLVAGRDSSEGFVNLLRRTIAPAQVLTVCVEEWRKTPALPAADRARLEAAWAQRQSQPIRERDIAPIYRELTQSLTRR